MTTKPAAEICATPGLFQTLKTFPATVHALLFFTLIIRFSYFMAWPFIAVIMTQNYHMSPIAIGVAMTSSALISVVLGMYGGPLIGGVMLAMTGAGVFIGTALLSLLLCVIIYACRINTLVRLQDS
jgi:hypothetical protein